MPTHLFVHLMFYLSVLTGLFEDHHDITIDLACPLKNQTQSKLGKF